MPWSVENEDVIREVQKRTSLYDHSAYTDKAARERLWREVCQSLSPDDFHELDDDEIDNRIKEIRKKWRNLRDCFTKDLNQRSGAYSGRRKRRKYLYYEQLQFLLPFVQPGEKTSSAFPTFKKEDNSEDNNSDNNYCTEDSEQPLPYSIVSFPGPDGRRDASRPAGGVDPSAFLANGGGSWGEEEIDEDKAFLLSLVPAFRRFSAKRKLAAKIEVLQVIQRISYPDE